MKKKHLFILLILLLITGVVLTALRVVRAETRTFTLPWSVIGSGGMGGSAGAYTIHSTLGQPVAGGVAGGNYSLTSGFWTKIIESITEFFSFLPLILR